MDFLLSEDQRALQDELRRFLTSRVDHDRRAAAADLPGAVDRDLWSELAGLGVFGIHTPEDGGGVGLGLADAAVVFEELGRVAVPGPTIATCLAAALGVAGAVDGSAVVGMVGADTLLVEHLDGLDVLLVHHDGLVEQVEPPDGTTLPRPLDPLTPVAEVATMPHGDQISGDAGTVITHGRLLTAAFQIGLGQSAVDMGTAYAAERQQFGKAIGSFQAVKHLLADAVVAVDIGRAGVHAAAVALDEATARGADVEPDGVHTMSVDAARIVASDAAQRATEANIQVHGGIGFTWELDAHLYLKRSLALDTTFGTVEASRRAVAHALSTRTS